MKKLLLLCFLFSINFTISRAQVIFDTIGAGSALQFSGIDGSHIELGNPYPTLNFPFTVQAWVNPADISSFVGGIFCTNNDTAAYYGAQIRQIWTGQLDITFGNGGGVAPQYRRGFVTDNSFPINQWTQLTIVSISVTNVSIYFNGVLQSISADDGTSTDINFTWSPNGHTNIGEEWNAGVFDPFDGQIDEVRLWNIALTQSEIQHDMCKKINPDTTGLIGYWRADEASNNDSVYDYTPNHVNGVIVGTVGREISDAPFGNSSRYLYTSNFSGQSVRCGAANGDSLITSLVTGAPDGVQVYAVNSPPYYTEGLHEVPKNYFGVFCINGSSPTYQATYHYSLSDGFLNPTSQDSANLDYRIDATDTPWQFLNATLNTSLQTVTKTVQSSPEEYILSFHDYFPVAGFTASQQTICAGSTITFTNKSTGTIVNTMWTFGGGAKPDTSYVLSPTATFGTPGTFHVLLTETNNAGSDTAGTTITVVALPVLAASPSPAKICFNQTSAQLSVSGASTYTWSPSTGLSATTGSSVIANPKSTTTYTITGTNANQCTSTTTVVVTVDPLPVVSVTPSSPQICYGQSIALTASGALNYQWSPSTALSSTSGVSITASPTATITYTLLGTTSSGCSSSTQFTLKVNPLPVMSVIAAAPQICIGQSVKINSGGASTYTWSPSTSLNATTGSLVTANPTATTTYTVTGTSSFGCIDSTTTTIKVNPLPIITIIPPDTALCRGYSATLKARGASAYQWIPAKGLNSNSDSIVVATPTINTTYRVNGTSTFGCIDSTNIAIRVVQDSLKAAITDTAICQGNSATLTASGDYAYTWSPSTGLNATTGNTVVANPTLTTSYTLIGTGPIGCLDTEQVVVKINLPPVLIIAPSLPVICIGHPTPLSVSGASIYSWSPASGLNQTSGSSVSATPTVTTTYTAYGTDIHGCNDSTKVVVKVNPLPVVTVAPLDSLVCNGLSVPLTVSGAPTNTYTWSPASGLNYTTGTAVVAAPLATTTYTVYGTDTAGCTDTVMATVRIIPNTIVITVTPANSIICQGGSASLYATGGINYLWSPPTDLMPINDSSVLVYPSTTATYTVIGIGIGHCSDTTNAVITVSPPPTLSIQPSSPTMCAGQDMLISVSGASSYIWEPATGLYETVGTMVNAHDTTTTSYIVYGVDTLGCDDSLKFTLVVKPEPSSSFTTGVPSICSPLQIQFSNTSTDGVSYFWNFGDGDTSTEQNPAHLFAKTGIYTITLISTSENGCMDTLITADTLTNGHSNLFVANSFTPSIQGMNQTFKPDIVCTAPSNYFLKIYDRWGVMLFESDDPTIGWDGTYKGKPQPLGTYVYYLQVNCGICTYSNKGDLTLIR